MSFIKEAKDLLRIKKRLEKKLELQLECLLDTSKNYLEVQFGFDERGSIEISHWNCSKEDFAEDKECRVDGEYIDIVGTLSIEVESKNHKTFNMSQITADHIMELIY